MYEYVYSVNMDTQLGMRSGLMYLRLSGMRVEGTLNILENEELIHGEIIGNGKCRLYGQIITRMRAVGYTAEGTFNKERISLILHSERNDFHITGTAVTNREKTEDINEKIL